MPWSLHRAASGRIGPTDGVMPVPSGKPSRVVHVEYKLSDEFPVFNSILNNSHMPSFVDFLEMGKEFVAMRMDSHIPNAITNGFIPEESTAHHLLVNSVGCANNTPGFDINKLIEDCRRIHLSSRWLHIRDRLRLGLPYLKKVLEELKSVNEVILIEDAETNTQDTFRDKKKNSKKRGKYGPRNITEFARFKLAIEKGLKKGRTKIDIAREFTHGDSKEIARLLRRFDRHREPPK
jgi:hypothetical protein